MSHEIVKSIVLKDKEQEVWLNSADSSVRPLYFSSWECKGLSEVYQKEGREAALARIGKDIWDGNLHLRAGNKMCKLFLAAREALPQGLSFMSLDGQAAGKYLAQAVLKLEKDPRADLTADVQALLALKDDRNYILETAKRTGHSYLNEACAYVQKDRAFALEVMRACGGTAWAEYPKMYENDKAFALELLALNGCHYRSLSPKLKADRDVILAAFEEVEGKQYHEHLPDLIPMEAYVHSVHDGWLEFDKIFLKELVEKCPSIHLERCPPMMQDRDVCLKWCEVGKWFPYSVDKVPSEFLLDPEFQRVLVARFQGTDKFEILTERLAQKGILLQEGLGGIKPSLEAMISGAEERKKEVPVKITDRDFGERE